MLCSLDTILKLNLVTKTSKWENLSVKSGGKKEIKLLQERGKRPDQTDYVLSGELRFKKHGMPFIQKAMNRESAMPS